MTILIVVVGKVRGPLEPAVRDYEDRARHYWKLDVVQVSAGAGGSTASPSAVRAAEADRILAKIPAAFEVVALTRTGKGMDSRELAGYLEEHGVRAMSGVAFVVGGAFGLGDAVLARARRKLSLSEMTFPHEMARLFVAEQLYRAGTILRGEPYHKG